MPDKLTFWIIENNLFSLLSMKGLSKMHLNSNLKRKRKLYAEQGYFQVVLRFFPDHLFIIILYCFVFWERWQAIKMDFLTSWWYAAYLREQFPKSKKIDWLKFPFFTNPKIRKWPSLFYPCYHKHRYLLSFLALYQNDEQMVSVLKWVQKCKVIGCQKTCWYK